MAVQQVTVPMASGKKSLVAAYNEQGFIVIQYEPAGGVLPRVLQGQWTTFEKAEQAIKAYLNAVR